MILDADKREADALLDLLDKANRAHGLNVSYWCLHWAQKVKAAEAKAAQALTIKAASAEEIHAA